MRPHSQCRLLFALTVRAAGAYPLTLQSTHSFFALILLVNRNTFLLFFIYLSIFQYCRTPLAGITGRWACQCKNKRGFKSIERETSKHESEVKIKVWWN